MISDRDNDVVMFDESVALALAESVAGAMPGAHVKQRLLASLVRAAVPPIPAGFAVRSAAERDWLPHPVAGIKMKVLSMNRARGYATLLLDVAPGTRFPAHHHSGDEECYVISGSVFSLGLKFGPGDFLHADAGTEHGELWTEEGATVLLVVEPEDYMPHPVRP
jgi:quercetin dioxygenase-like cupin family protein